VTMMGIETVQPGWKVVDEQGNDVGEVTEVTGQYVRVRKSGLLTSSDCYLPREAIGSAEDKTVWLTVPKTDLDKYKEPPRSN
jgi:hypothetical protein